MDVASLTARFRTQAATPAARPTALSALKMVPGPLDRARDLAFRRTAPFCDVAPAMRQLERALEDENASIVRSASIGGQHINAVSWVLLSNGLQGIWKPLSQEADGAPRPSIPAGGQNRREPAAYFVDKRMGHAARVPPSVLRMLEAPGKAPELGALSVFLSYARLMAGTPNPESKAYRSIAILDNVIGNLDRHGNNVLLNLENEKIPSDHGLTFPIRNGNHGGKLNYVYDARVKLTDAELQKLAELTRDRAVITSELTALGIEPEAIAAFFERVATMTAHKRTYASWRA